jgi:hypothetical protein
MGCQSRILASISGHDLAQARGYVSYGRLFAWSRLVAGCLLIHRQRQTLGREI